MNRRQTMVGLLAFAALCGNACAPAVVVREPPPPRYGVIGIAPGPGYVWTEGYWGWQGGQWVWTPGRWLLEPRPGAVWIPGHWIRGRWGRWRFIPGHWR